MKKNVMMRVASLLMVCVLATTCGISGTFAKYVTADDGSDFARVAKFGVVIEADSFDMFKANYDDTVVSLGETDDLIAPGTEGEFGSISITGTPEVTVDVDIVATVDVTGDWMIGSEFYCPVYVTIGADTFCGLDYDSAALFAAAIKGALDGKSATYDPNTDLGSIYDTTALDMSWVWHFEGNTEGGTGHVDQTDVKDTILGDRSAAVVNPADALKISIAVEISVTQVD